MLEEGEASVSRLNEQIADIKEQIADIKDVLEVKREIEVELERLKHLV